MSDIFNGILTMNVNTIYLRLEIHSTKYPQISSVGIFFFTLRNLHPLASPVHSCTFCCDTKKEHRKYRYIIHTFFRHSMYISTLIHLSSRCVTSRARALCPILYKFNHPNKYSISLSFKFFK